MPIARLLTVDIITQVAVVCQGKKNNWAIIRQKKENGQAINPDLLAKGKAGNKTNEEKDVNLF